MMISASGSRTLKIFSNGDCVASVDAEEYKHALKRLKRVLKADVKPSSKIDSKEFKKAA